MFRKLRRILGLSKKHKRSGKAATSGTRIHAASRTALQSGASHPTLGSNLKGHPFGESGRDGLNAMLELGLKPDDVVVDYGCGTLRIGYHLISYLQAGNYWGMDLDTELLKAGRDLIGSDLDRDKRPELHVIDEEAVALAVKAEPRFFLSYAVLPHVRAKDLDTYFAHAGRFLHAGATAIIAVRNEVSRSGATERDEKRWERHRRNEAALRAWVDSENHVSREIKHGNGRLIVIEKR